MKLLLLYAEFFKIGVFSIGGGLATLPFLYNLAARYGWIRAEQIGNFLAIAQSAPGAIGVNMAAQTGYAAAGFPGLVLAPLGLISPAIIVILLVSRILTAVKESTVVKAVFGGLRPAAAGLITAAGFGVIALSLYSGSAGRWYEDIRWKELVLFAVLFLLIWKFKKHPILYIAAAGTAGIFLGL
ncbi:chromate transporter [Spirochaetia bacterium]|nr:chromate transporter [Spirochaetia bacterium]